MAKIKFTFEAVQNVNMADFMPNIIKPLSTTAGRTVFVNSLKKALTSLPLHEIELISQVNTTPIDVLPRASVLAPLYISPENEKVGQKCS